MEVRTAAGVLRGIFIDQVAVFRGIRYAEWQRFGAPVPVQRWDGVRDATAFGPPSPHADCLSLNVYSPDVASARLPVMVWIHGGRYLEGSSANPHYDGAVMATAGVVFVSLNYRVGVEGFAHVDGSPDNRGLLDQLAALRWVQDNIAVFGGDPDNVTVFGQSAGAGCIAALLAMPTAAGLFHRAILQSTPGTYFTPQLAAAISETIAAEVGARPIPAELTKIPARVLIDASEALIQKMPEFIDSWGPVALTPTPFSPVVDGVVLPEAPWRALSDGAARGVDLLVGHTRDEYSLFKVHEQIVDALPITMGAYRAAYPESSFHQLCETVHADWIFRMPSLHLANAQHAGGGPVWMYELCWGFDEFERASHSLDLLLVFGTFDADDAGLSAQMRSEWVQFATAGAPGWDRYDPDQRLTRVYTTSPTTQRYPEERSRQIWSAHQFAAL